MNTTHSFVKMKYLAFVILVTIQLCGANNFLCQLFDGKTKSFEKYCENVRGIVSEYCINEELNFIDPAHVERLRIGGCNQADVLISVKRLKNIRVLDISDSDYKVLNWLDLKLVNLRKFNASHNELSYVRMLLKNSTPGVTEIDLSHNQIRTIGSETFGSIQKLAKIILSHNVIEYISFDAFSVSSDLHYIDLRSNRFLMIPLLFDNKKLTTLHLESNPIERFNYCCLSMMRASASVYFSWTNVKDFWRSENCPGGDIKPVRVVQNSDYEGISTTRVRTYEMHCDERSFQSLSNFTAGRNAFANAADLLRLLGQLVHLDLSHNFIGKLDLNTFEKFDRLTTLTLSNTMLTDIDFSMLHTKYLVKLDISNNQLNYMNNISLLENFHALAIFNVSGNRLENVPDLIQYLTSSVQRLDLSGNFVGKLKANTFQRLPSLNVLNLRNTYLSVADFCPFKPLENLNVLDISQNNLKNVNFTVLSSLNKLNDLNVANCEIENVWDLTQHLGASLRKLDLSGNSVRSLNSRMLSTLSNLESLILSNANTIDIDNGALQHQSGLRSLDLSYNKLQRIDFEMVSRHLRNLNLEGNDLNRVDNLSRKHFPQLKSLAISKNHFSCQFLRYFLIGWKGTHLVGDSIDQKHHENCRSSSQGVKDFLGSVYDSVRFW